MPVAEILFQAWSIRLLHADTIQERVSARVRSAIHCLQGHLIAHTLAACRSHEAAACHRLQLLEVRNDGDNTACAVAPSPI